MPLWDVKARYAMRGGAAGETEDVHMAYLEAPTAESALEAAGRRGIATEAHSAGRGVNSAYIDLIAVPPVYYVYDWADDFLLSSTDPEDALGEAVAAVTSGAAKPDQWCVIDIGDDDGPAERVGRVWLSSIGPQLELEAPTYAPPAWRVRTAREVQVAGETLTIRPVAAWFAREDGGTFRDQIMRSPVQPTEPSPVVPYIDLEEAQRQRFANLELDDKRKEVPEEHGGPISQRFANIELNPPRVYRAQRVVAKLAKDERPVFTRGSVVRSPRDVAESLADYMGQNAHESFVVVHVNVRNQIVGYTEFTSGNVASVEVTVAGILRDALAAGGAAMVTAHVHPTGDPDPSNEDRALWARIKAAGELVGIPVLDNLVIGEGRFYSEASNETGGL